MGAPDVMMLSVLVSSLDGTTKPSTISIMFFLQLYLFIYAFMLVMSNDNLGLVSCDTIQIDVSQDLCYFTCFFLRNFVRWCLNSFIYLCGYGDS
jgi:hypothetical protein